MRETIEQKAQRYILERRVNVVAVNPLGGTAEVVVQGTAEAPYVVRLSGGLWVCSCPAQVPRCAHVIASSMVVTFVRHPEHPAIPSQGPYDDLFERRLVVESG